MRISFLLIVCFSLPAMAQLYSYRSPTGQLVITDQPVRKKGYKLVDKFIPREEKNVTERVLFLNPLMC